MGLERSLKEYELNYRSGGKYYADRRFVVEVAGSLSGASLEEGDTLPEDATYRIITSGIVRDKKTGLARFIDVTAEKQVASRTELTQFLREEEEGGLFYLHCLFQIPLGAGLTGQALNEHDVMPGHTTYRIIQSRITVGGNSALANMVEALGQLDTASRAHMGAFDEEENRGGLTLYHRRYWVPMDTSLATNSLEEGDVLPAGVGEPSNAEIIHSQLVRGPRGSYAVIAVVTARKFGTWAD